MPCAQALIDDLEPVAQLVQRNRSPNRPPSRPNRAIARKAAKHRRADAGSPPKGAERFPSLSEALLFNGRSCASDVGID